MKIVEFLPYYDELRTGGHMAVALASAFVGGAGMWIAAWAFSDANRFGFCESFALALFWASGLWILPSGFLSSEPVWEKSAIAGVLVLPIFILYFGFSLGWKNSARICAAFCLTQLAVLLTISYYINR